MEFDPNGLKDNRIFAIWREVFGSDDLSVDVRRILKMSDMEKTAVQMYMNDKIDENEVRDIFEKVKIFQSV